MAKLASSILLALSISIVPLVAEADKDRGDGGGGGRLGQVSSGLGQATGGSGSSGGGGSSGNDDWHVRDHRHHEVEYVAPVIVEGGDGVPDMTPPSRPRSVSVDFYAGVQKVFESDGSLSVELAFNEGRFRLGGSISRYFEQLPDERELTFTLGSLYLGLRIDDGGPTRAYLEAGAVGGRTSNDPLMDSSVGGVLGGVRVEHKLLRHLSVVGDAQLMVFEKDVRAGAMRAGFRVGYLQATLRYLDLNVGPALFGPELGFRF